MTVPHEIRELIERFETHAEEYRFGQYNETMLRRDFVDPFFEALGWDVNNRRGYAESYRDVVHEDAIKVGGSTKAPDYGFYVGETRKFFVEAKKPSVNLKLDPAPAFQLRRYGWSAKLPLSVLTNFDEFAVYDCRSLKPASTDKAQTARIIYYTYQDYAEKWDEIAGVFSRDAVWRGEFDKFAGQARTRRGTAEVDDAFLEEIESWRKTLASNIYLRNPQLTTRELNFAVGIIIDRVIFLRICEDRGIEPEEQLKRLINGKNLYEELTGIFYRADQKYNSGLFHFDDEKGRAESPDTLTPRLKIDDKVLKDIFRNIYLPVSPYEFSVLPADILGQVYEQFLGKVIHLTAHRAVVEDKPEVRKAGGVYYTPSYIVDYIVRQTVGKLCEGRTPKQVDRLRVLDPACGSGSFLISAYQHLLDWYLNFYKEDGAEKHIKRLRQGARGEWRLTTAERKRILRQNIYGVDIDSQAVEVTKLSLLLKVLEGESEQSLARQLSLLHERALPDLGSNIKCGNSLIGRDFYDDAEAGRLGDEELYRINVFDWKEEFAEIMQGGGFDAVIGNPPYIRIQTMKEWAPVEVEFYKRNYASAKKGNYDIYVVFVEKGLSLLNRDGKLGFILPHKFFNAQYGEPLREILSRGNHLESVVHFGHQQVFAQATTYTCLLFLSKAGRDQCHILKVDDLEKWQSSNQFDEGNIPASNITISAWNFVVGANSSLFKKLNEIRTKLGDIADIFVGLQTSADDIFIMNFIAESAKEIRLYSRALQSEWMFEKDLLFPLVSGTDVNRYQPLPSRQFILFPYKVDGTSAQLISWSKISAHYPKAAAYLLRNKKRLEDRERGKFRGENWYRFGRNQNIGIQEQVKLCVPRLVEHLYAAYDIEGNHFLDNVDVGGVTLKIQHQKLGLAYLLGLLNASLLRWYFPSVSAPFRGGYWSANRQFLSQLPIRLLNVSNYSDKARHDRMVELVEQMLSLHKQLAQARTEQERNVLQRRLDATDKQIDALVYQLYDLTDEEIKIVEAATQ